MLRFYAELERAPQVILLGAFARRRIMNPGIEEVDPPSVLVVETTYQCTAIHNDRDAVQLVMSRMEDVTRHWRSA